MSDKIWQILIRKKKNVPGLGPRGYTQTQKNTIFGSKKHENVFETKSSRDNSLQGTSYLPERAQDTPGKLNLNKIHVKVSRMGPELGPDGCAPDPKKQFFGSRTR